MISRLELDVVVTEQNYDEKAYLEANPDVKKAVDAGSYRSGKRHFDRHGKRENRKLRQKNEAQLNTMRNEKLQKLEKILRQDMQRDDEMGIPSFLSRELSELAQISETDNISGHGYDSHAMELINQYPDGLILDCGAGRRPVYYSNVVNFEIVPYDTTDVLGVGEELPFKSESFDAVVSLAVLEHVQNPFQCAKEISRVLKQGGKLYCAVPFLQPYHGYPHHYFNATHQGIRRLFEDYLDIDEVFVPPSNHPVVALSWMIRSWAAGLNERDRRQFLSTKLVKFLDQPSKTIDQNYCRNLPPDKITELACANFLTATKHGGS